MEYILTITWLTSLLSAIYIAQITPPATKYELSLFNAFPGILWFFTIFATACGIIILIISSFSIKPRGNWWISGLLAVVLTNIFIISLPLYRGYPINDRADTLNHIGYVRDIALSGKLGDADFYPAMHFIQFTFEKVGRVSAGEAVILINIIFIALWTLAAGMLAYRLSRDVRVMYLAFAFSAPLSLHIYHTVALPSTLSTFFISMALSLHLQRFDNLKGQKISAALAEIILGLLIVYFHPSSTLFFIALLITIELATRIYSHFHAKSQHKIFTAVPMVTTMVVIFFTWYISFSVITNNFAQVIRWLAGERDRTSAIGEALGLLQMANISFVDVTKILFNSFSLPVIFGGSTILLAGVLIVKATKKQIILTQHQWITIALLATTILLILVMFLISTSERYPIRLLRMLVILSIPISAWWLWEFWFKPEKNDLQQRKSENRAGVTFIILTIFTLVIIGQLNVYPHPRNGQPNTQVTYSEIAGMKWLLENRDNDAQQASILPEYVPRFEAFFSGYTGRQTRPNWWILDVWTPSHFYHPDWGCFAKIGPGQTTYLAISQNGLISWMRFPEAVRDRAHIYTGNDLSILSADISINKIYDNGGFQVWVTRKELSNCEN
jgi:hypothetical protein